MTMKVNIKDQYLEQFEDFKNSLPKDAIEINTIDDVVSFDEATNKVQKAINNISLNQGINLDNAFEKIANS